MVATLAAAAVAAGGASAGVMLTNGAGKAAAGCISYFGTDCKPGTPSWLPAYALWAAGHPNGRPRTVTVPDCVALFGTSCEPGVPSWLPAYDAWAAAHPRLVAVQP